MKQLIERRMLRSSRRDSLPSLMYVEKKERTDREPYGAEAPIDAEASFRTGDFIKLTRHPLSRVKSYALYFLSLRSFRPMARLSNFASSTVLHRAT